MPFFLQVFLANSDQTAVVRNNLKPLIKTRFIRINLKTWHGLYPSMRAEFYGCRGKSHTNIIFVGGGDGEMSLSFTTPNFPEEVVFDTAQMLFSPVINGIFDKLASQMLCVLT